MIAKLRAKDRAKAKDTSKGSAKAGANESDSSDNPSTRNNLYRAPGNRNKQKVSTSSHVSSTKSSSKEGSPAKKTKVDNSHSGHADPPQVTSGQRQLTMNKMHAKKGSSPLDTPPKKPIRQGSCSLDRLSSKKSFGQELLETDLRRKLGTKSPSPKLPMTVNPYAVPPPPPI